MRFGTFAAAAALASAPYQIAAAPLMADSEDVIANQTAAGNQTVGNSNAANSLRILEQDFICRLPILTTFCRLSLFLDLGLHNQRSQEAANGTIPAASERDQSTLEAQLESICSKPLTRWVCSIMPLDKFKFLSQKSGSGNNTAVAQGTANETLADLIHSISDNHVLSNDNKPAVNMPPYHSLLDIIQPEMHFASEVADADIRAEATGEPTAPIAEAPAAAETPAAVETPAVEAPAVEAPAVEAPAVETATVETPTVETPAVVASNIESILAAVPSEVPVVMSEVATAPAAPVATL
ncbi:hypothetical protein K402DRAFT_454143 [Aulographum hederae CBS 113979]|uniref:Uncharacterized protein n=1 Tax=Aulographum hederae CBS 113979 TaxID=1176131 RepID=A0A6G1GZT3_9PEZI|nr:hypothetical protein K402DRAFT_454143 [Aulographum hederae CBS 113979]